MEKIQTAEACAAFRLASLFLLLLILAAQVWVSRLYGKIRVLEDARRRSADYAAELNSVRELKAGNSTRTRAAMADMVKARRTLYETGLSLQEEKRLLEKQLEIMTTYLELDQENGKINLLRGDQVIKGFPFSYVPLMSAGKEKIAVPELCRITAKERFAAPERGKAEKTEAGLTWDPPQSGETLRDKALGEYAVFTNCPLILHAPVANAALHDAYPHLCAGLTLYSAKALYDNVFIGNKLLIKGAKGKSAAPVPAVRKKTIPKAKSKPIPSKKKSSAVKKKPVSRV